VAALVTSLDNEILTLGRLYRDRTDCENTFDELKNQWGWGGLTTHDLKRCRLAAGMVALIYNWWSLFVRLADPKHHREAITSRPLLLSAIARRTQHAAQVTLTIRSAQGMRDKAPSCLCLNRQLPGRLVENCGAVGSPRTVVSHPQGGAALLPQRPTTATADPTQTSRNAYPRLSALKPARPDSPQLPDLGYPRRHNILPIEPAASSRKKGLTKRPNLLYKIAYDGEAVKL
jgi:hypothetical protein